MLQQECADLRHTVERDHLQALVGIAQGAHLVGHLAERNELRRARPHILLVHLERIKLA